MTATSLTGDPATDNAVPSAELLVQAVRRGDAAAVRTALESAADKGTAGLYSLVVVLAAMVPDDKPASALLAWLQPDEAHPDNRIIERVAAGGVAWRQLADSEQAAIVAILHRRGRKIAAIALELGITVPAARALLKSGRVR